MNGNLDSKQECHHRKQEPWMKILRSKLVFAALLLFLSSACILTPTVTPVPPVGAPTAQGAAPGGATQAPQAGQPTMAPTTAGNGQSSAGGALSLQVLSPQDGAVVNTAQVQVTGTAAPGEVVSVNDDVITIGADGGFQSTVTLSEGPNLIEIIASNDAGAETSVELTVTYTP
jgi:glucodextranase-like protein